AERDQVRLSWTYKPVPGTRRITFWDSQQVVRIRKSGESPSWHVQQRISPGIWVTIAREWTWSAAWRVACWAVRRWQRHGFHALINDVQTTKHLHK
ncbi:MAG TPA: hypothetical protein VK054_06880, partial [Beutenbergiaceae bacterium]|nr:hypothetical protein [Beutenbergiaceae bacterium]